MKHPADVIQVPFYTPPADMQYAMEAAARAQMAGHGSHGPEVDHFERKIAEYHGVAPHKVVCFDSCTSALAISLFVLRSQRVLVPTITWNATANAAKLAGCEVQFGGVSDEALLGWSLDAVESDVDTIVGVHLYGQRWPILDDSRQIVIDAAQAFELPIDEQAAATCFSFHTLKSVGIGVGGAAIFKYEHDAMAAAMVRFHGMSLVGRVRRQQLEGWKATMPAFAAAMGVELLASVDARHEARKATLRSYTLGIRRELQLERVSDVEDDAAHAFVVRVKNREGLRDRLGLLGIETAHYYPAIHSQPHWRPLNEGKHEDDIALGEGLVALPLNSELTQEQVSWVIDCVNEHGEPA